MRRSVRRQHRFRRGQSLIIFALSFTVLLGLVGLAIDVARAYDTYARMQRAAEAGALAGVLYMPNYYNTAIPAPGDGNSAVSRAVQEVIKNGFGAPVSPTFAGACPNLNTSVEVAVCPVSGKVNDLRVTVTETLDLVLLSGLGVQPITLSASAQAEYLPPVQLGSRLNYFGDQVECTSGSSGSNRSCNLNDGAQHLQYFMATVKGPATLKEQGDPMVYCEEGPSDPKTPDLPAGQYRPYNYDFSWTNHPQYSSSAGVIQQHCGLPIAGGNAGNPDYQPSGYSGPATQNSQDHPGGYNYTVTVPSGITTGSVWIYNPSFIPDNSQQFDSVDVAFGMHPRDPFGNGIANFNGNFDAPPYYFTLTYSIYEVNSLYDRSTDTLQASVAFPPYDNYNSDAQRHGCNGARTAYDPAWEEAVSGGALASSNSYHDPAGIISGAGCVDLTSSTPPVWHLTSGFGPQTTVGAPCYQQWCAIKQNLGPGTYRLVVEATGLTSRVAEYTSGANDGWGTHSYAVKVCAQSGLTDPIGCSDGASAGSPGVTIYGWNNMEVDFAHGLTNQNPDPNNPETSCAQTANTRYTCLDLGCIPTAYAGRNVTLRLFDPGDGSGDLYIGPVAPQGSNATVTYDSWIQPLTSSVNGVNVVHARYTSPQSYNAFDGIWLTATLNLPATYVGDCQTGQSGTGWWQLLYASSNGGQPHDWLNVQFTLVGSPVHLVQLG
jgi:hypothetical protein